jgi:TolA-binding protein
VALLAPPAYTQRPSTQDQLNQLMTDVLNLTNSVKQLQTSADTRNAEIANALQQVLSRFGAIDASFHRVDAAVGAIRAENEKTAQGLKGLQELKASVDALKSNFTQTTQGLQQDLVTLQNLVKAVKEQQTAAQTVETPLATAAQIYNEADASYNQGFYDLAIPGFREFLRNYPKDIRSQSAQIRIGDSLSAQRKFDQALLEYDLASQNYPNGDRTCVALYKKGLTLVELKQNPEAIAAFNAVVKECSGTPEAASAADALKRVPRK